MKKSYVIMLLFSSALSAMITRHTQPLEAMVHDSARDSILRMIISLENQCAYSAKGLSQMRRGIKRLGNRKEDDLFMNRLQQLCDDLREMINEKLPRIKEALPEIK